jgi:hypothetical protein
MEMEREVFSMERPVAERRLDGLVRESECVMAMWVETELIVLPPGLKLESRHSRRTPDAPFL